MKPLTETQKRAIIDSITEANNAIIKKRTEEIRSAIGIDDLDEEEKTYHDMLCEYHDMSNSINELSNKRNTLLCKLYNNRIYNSGDVYVQDESREAIDNILLDRLSDARARKELNVPDENIMRRELTLLSISKDVDIESFIKKFTIKK